ncbi:MAG: hypothetical protein VW547_01980 [Alphaproteobacteria bacterium]
MTFDDFMKNVPTILSILAALGLWHVAAALARKAWAKVKAWAKGTPSKLDDAIVEAVEPQVLKLIELVDGGNFAAAQAKVNEIKAAAKKR